MQARRYFIYIMVWLLPLCAVARTARRGTQTDEQATRGLSYYYIEGVKKSLLNKYDEAFMLFNHCLALKPDAPEVHYRLGMCYMMLNEAEQAGRHLEQAYRLDSTNMAYKEILASYYLNRRDKGKATLVLEDMARCNPSRSDVLAQLVALYLDAMDYRHAIACLDRIETLEGRTMGTAMEKFRLYHELEEDENGFAELERLSAEHPNDLSYKVLIGDQYLLVGNQEKALEIYEEVRRKDPENGTLALSMLDYYKQTGAGEQFQALFRKVLFAPATTDRTRLMLMNNFVVEREQAKADSTEVLEVFDSLFVTVPETVDMLSLYAAYLQQKRMGNRITGVMERILKLEPDNQPALYQLVREAVQANDLPRVVEVCGRGISHHPEAVGFYFYKGFAHYMLDQDRQALETFGRGVRQPKTEDDYSLVSDMYSITGDLYYKLGKKDSAYAAYDSSLVYNPKNIGCLNNYAYYLSQTDEQLDKAERMSRQTIEAEPSNKTYLDTYAWVLFKMGRYGEAKLYIDRVLTGDYLVDERVSAGVIEHAGDIYACMGDLESALHYWNLALKKDGDVSAVLRKKIQQKKYLKK